jgi:hypothetical protein
VTERVYRPQEFLRVLARHGVEFVVVEMTAAVLQGAAYLTRDLDVVYLRSEENISRALAALDEAEAYFRGRPDMPPDRSYLRSRGHELLSTRYGDCDFLGHVGPDVEYPDLVDQALTLDFGDFSARVAPLSRIVALKTHANRPKDQAVLPGLRSLLKELQHQSDGQT